MRPKTIVKTPEIPAGATASAAGQILTDLLIAGDLDTVIHSPADNEARVFYVLPGTDTGILVEQLTGSQVSVTVAHLTGPDDLGARHGNPSWDCLGVMFGQDRTREDITYRMQLMVKRVRAHDRRAARAADRRRQEDAARALAGA